MRQVRYTGKGRGGYQRVFLIKRLYITALGRFAWLLLSKRPQAVRAGRFTLTGYKRLSFREE